MGAVLANKNKTLGQVQKHIAREQYDRAIKLLEQLVEEDPNDVRSLLKLGDVYVKKGDRDVAVKVYKRVAKQYSEQGFFMKAVAIYKQILKHKSKNVEALMQLAELYEHLGLASEARQQYLLAESVLQESGNADAALALMQKQVELDPDNVAHRIKLAEAYSSQDNVPAATRQFAAAAEVLRRQNREDDFVKVAERLVYHDPNRPEILKDLARLYLSRGDAKRALAKLQLCFRSHPKDIDTLELLAQAFSELRQYARTKTVYQGLVEVLEDKGLIGKAEEYRLLIRQLEEADRPTPASPKAAVASSFPNPSSAPEGPAAPDRLNDRNGSGMPSIPLPSPPPPFDGQASANGQGGAHLSAVVMSPDASAPPPAVHSPPGTFDPHVDGPIDARIGIGMSGFEDGLLGGSHPPRPASSAPSFVAPSSSAAPGVGGAGLVSPQFAATAPPYDAPPLFSTSPEPGIPPGEHYSGHAGNGLAAPAPFAPVARPPGMPHPGIVVPRAHVEFDPYADDSGQVADFETEQGKRPAEPPAEDLSGASGALDEVIIEAPVESSARSAPPPPPQPPASVSQQVSSLLRDAKVYQRYNLPAGALEQLQRAHELDPNNVEVLEHMRDLYVSEGDSARAAEIVAQIVTVHRRNGDRDAAEKAKQQIAQLAPGHPLAVDALPNALSGYTDDSREDSLSFVITEDSGSFEIVDMSDSGSVPDLEITEEAPSPDLPEPEFAEESLLDDELQRFSGELSSDSLHDAVQSLQTGAALDNGAVDDDPFASHESLIGYAAEPDAAPEDPTTHGEPLPRLDPADDDPPEATNGHSMNSDLPVVPDFSSAEALHSRAGLPNDLAEANGEYEPVTAQVPHPLPLPDLTDELAEVQFFLDIDDEPGAHDVLRELLNQHPGHPEVLALALALNVNVDQAETTDGRIVPPDAVSAPKGEAERASDQQRSGDREVYAAANGIQSASDAPTGPINGEAGANGIHVDGFPPAEASGSLSGQGGADGAGVTSADVQEAFDKALDETMGGNDPSEVQDAYDQGMALMEIDRTAQAIEAFVRAAEWPSMAATAREMLVRCYAKMDQPGEAVAHFRDAENHGVSGAAATHLKYLIGACFERSGDLVHALEWFQACAEDSPDHEDVREQVKRIALLVHGAPHGEDTAGRRNKISYL